MTHHSLNKVSKVLRSVKIPSSGESVGRECAAAAFVLHAAPAGTRGIANRMIRDGRRIENRGNGGDRRRGLNFRRSVELGVEVGEHPSLRVER